MRATPSPRLLGDLGGIHLRLAWQTVEGAPLENMLNLSCAEYVGPVRAIHAYQQRTGPLAPGACGLCHRRGRAGHRGPESTRAQHRLPSAPCTRCAHQPEPQHLWRTA